MRKRGLRFCLIFLATFLLVPNAYATSYVWTVDPDLTYGTTQVNNPYWVTHGYWDVKAFQWGDPDNTYPSGFSYTWQDGVVSIWVGDWEHEYNPLPPLIAGRKLKHLPQQPTEGRTLEKDD